MVDPVDLETNVLDFLHKSFMWLRSAEVAGEEIAVFQRTETESESRFRPKVLRLFVVVPTAWIVFDLAAEQLLLAQDGHTPLPRPAGSAQEAGAEGSEFVEQGIRFLRRPAADGWVYLPADRAALDAADRRSALGLPASPPGARR